MHPLTILAVGLYGEALPNQNGAPLRLVVPWKYGFKGIKSIVRIRFVEQQPSAAWQRQPERIRLLLQREPAGRSPALEPGERAAHRRVPQAEDADVQRLRRPGGQPLRRDGPQGSTSEADAAQRRRSRSSLQAPGVRRWRWRRSAAGGRRVRGTLGANPLEAITHGTGDWTLRFLLLTLAVTPLRAVTGWNALDPLPADARPLRVLLRRAAPADLPLVRPVLRLARTSCADIAKRPFITVGFTAFVLLVPLALTSTTGMIRRLGGRRWQALHRLVYVAARPGWCTSGGW